MTPPGPDRGDARPTAPSGGDADGAANADVDGEKDTDAGADGDVPPLELRAVTKEYDVGPEVVRALDAVDFRVDRGGFVSVVGPSGSGKSTMLNVLGLLDVPTSGEVLLDGRDVTTLTERERTNARKRYVGFVFQQFYLIDSLTAVENVTLPTVFDRDRDATARAERLLERVGLGDRLDHTPAQLSGGQKQRVAIARALINDPAVVLADEPTGNLDRATGRTILDEFRRICDESGVAVVTVTHDPLVSDYADREVELVDGVLRPNADGGEGPDGGDRDEPGTGTNRDRQTHTNPGTDAGDGGRIDRSASRTDPDPGGGDE